MLAEISPSFLWMSGTITVGAGLLHNYWRYRQDLRAIGNTPGIRSVISPVRPTMAILPSGKFPFSDWFFSIGPQYWSTEKYNPFSKAGQDIISSVALDYMYVGIMVADAEAAQEVLGNRYRFYKPIDIYVVLDLFGRNVLTTEFDDWRTHRRIASPAFSENNNRLVCEEAAFTIQELFSTWDGQKSVTFKNVTELFVQITLIIICSAGFGMRVAWKETTKPLGHELSFKETMEVVSSDLFMKLAVPEALMGVTKRTARVQLAFEELMRFMQEMVRERAKNYNDHSDLFSNLMAANARDNEGLRLTDQEVIGNIFIFLIAGHETTAHSLSFTMGLLAMYPEIQDKLYDHVVKNVSDPTGAPSYSELSSLSYVNAVFYETLRLFPSVPLIPKRSMENTTLKTVNSKGEPVVVPVPKGANVNIITTGLHYNPKYWDSPEKFMPERFLGDWPKKAFAPFSLGGRACIGRRFAEVESIVVLCMLVRNYRISIKEEPQYAGETFEQRYKRVFKTFNYLTLTPHRLPITFTRR
ncbi:cytochrome P450 [Serendipita vermifera]|nr:cytochrome P450 [Serendipita vermifera]